MTENNPLYHQSRIAVPAEFEEVFTHFYAAENASGEVITQTLLPSFQTILIFSFGRRVSFITEQQTEISMDKCIVAGPIKRAFRYSLPPHSEILVANFKDDAFFRFFGQSSIAEYTPVHPDDLLERNCFTLLWKELSPINESEERVDHILKFCRPYLQQQNPIIKQLTGTKQPTLNPVKLVAEQNRQTERNVQLNHRKYLGYSAKEQNRYQRFLKAVKEIQQLASNTTRKIDWFEIIDTCGYHDQSHLIRDFQYYLNLSPTQYLKFQQDICNSKL